MKPFQIEFIYQGDAIDTKSYDVLPYIPQVDEIIYLQCENPEMNNDNMYFRVVEKRTLFFSTTNLRQKVVIKLEPQRSTDW
jgi:hypothetical protein